MSLIELIGLPKEIRDQLFQPFSQGDASVTRQYGGAGLPVTMMNGTFDFDLS
jgi:hypothetical protein